jgi:hypothetical protein
VTSAPERRRLPANERCYDCGGLYRTLDLFRYLGATVCLSCRLTREEEFEELARLARTSWRPPYMTFRQWWRSQLPRRPRAEV